MPKHLRHETAGPHSFIAYKNLVSEKSSTDDYNILIIVFARSSFRDFGCYLRIVADLDEDDIQFILKWYSSHFIIYEIPPRIYTIKDIPGVIYHLEDHEGTLQIEFDDVSMKEKLILTEFVSAFRVLRFE